MASAHELFGDRRRPRARRTPTSRPSSPLAVAGSPPPGCSSRTRAVAFAAPGRGRGPRPAGQRRDARGRGVAGPRVRRRRRPAGRRAADARRRVPDRAPTAPTSASCSRRRTTRCPTTASSCSRRAGTSCPTTSRTRSRRTPPGPCSRPSGPPAPASAGSPTRPTRSSATSPTCSRPRRTRLDGLHVVVDCAHGAASLAAPELYRARRRPGHRDRRRARTAEHQRRRRLDPPRRPVRRRCVAHGADLGIAHDGDADRCLAVDADGAVVDGDQILGVSARSALHEAGELRDDTRRRHRDEQPRASTTPCATPGIAVLTTAVGDRYVLEALRARALSLGGEQSGHVVLHRRRHHRRRPAHRAARHGPDGRDRPRRWPSSPRVVQRLPQILVNVHGRATAPPSRRRRAVAEAVAAAERRTRRRRAGAAAPVGHRAARPGHGRGADRGRRARGRRPPRRPRRDRGLTPTAARSRSAAEPGAGPP